MVFVCPKPICSTPFFLQQLIWFPMLFLSISILRMTNSRPSLVDIRSIPVALLLHLLWTSCQYACKRRPIFHGEFMNKFVWLVPALFVRSHKVNKLKNNKKTYLLFHSFDKTRTGDKCEVWSQSRSRSRERVLFVVNIKIKTHHYGVRMIFDHYSHKVCKHRQLVNVATWQKRIRKWENARMNVNESTNLHRRASRWLTITCELIKYSYINMKYVMI